MPSKAKKTRIRLEDLDHPQVSNSEYNAKLKTQELKLLELQRIMSKTGMNLIVLFEGPDASGKGGAIKRLVERLDPHLLKVYSIIKPTEEEYRNHYMRRFWLRLPPEGRMSVFDRSWYGRVLVERVEGFATEAEWKRAFDEINTFEKMLTDAGTLIVKFYLQVDKKEQLARFKSRQADPYKHWKVTPEDWRNRRKWTQHVVAAEEMLERTSPKTAPWHVIGANHKNYTRLKVVTVVASALEKALGKLA